MRWSEQDLQHYLRRGQPAPMSEAAFQAGVVRLLRQYHYTFVYYTHNSKRSPEGFPDLIACHEQAGRVCLALELKTDTGQVTPAQQAWLDALQGSIRIETEVLRPAELEAFVARLREARG